MIIKKISKALPTDLGLRIFFYLAGAIILAGVVLDVIFFRIQEKQIFEGMRDHGQSIASLFAENIRAAVQSRDTTLLEPHIDSLFRQPGLVSVCIFNSRNELLYARKNPAATRVAAVSECDMANHRATTDASQLEAEGGMAFRESIRAPGDPSASGGQAGRQAVGTVLLRLSAEKLLERRRTLIKQSAILCLSFLAVLLPLTFVIVNESTRPLKNLRLRLRSKLPQENGKMTDIDSLEHTFDTMSSELENAFRTVEALKNHLGRKVAARTEELQRINANLEKTVVELKAAQRQLIHSEKMAGLGLLATGLAHEINNSLVLIKGSFYPLRKVIEHLEKRCRQGMPVEPEKFAETTVADLFQHIDTGVFRITSLLTDLMTFARPGNSTRKLIDINKELEMTLRLLHVVSGKEIAFIKEFSPVHPILCHESQIAQVFFNILLNAIQAIDRTGCIRINTATQGDWAVMVFADNGPGIGPELLDKIFDPFFTTKETGSGTGLGLSICYAIINEHGGEIEVTSEVGKGTVFTIRLPRYPAAHGAETEVAAVPVQTSGTTNRR